MDFYDGMIIINGLNVNNLVDISSSHRARDELPPL